MVENKFKKVEREYVLSDSSVNDYGFRLLTSGYQIDEFRKNPIGYYMHKRDDGVVVKWEGLRVEGDQVKAMPCINLTAARGQQTLDEVEAGFLNAASVGHFVILEASNDEHLKLPGQTGPTITKWFNRECSLVDIGSNFSSISLYSADGQEIKLADLMSGTQQESLLIFKSDIMNPITLSLPDLAAMRTEGITATDAAGLLTQIKELKLKAETASAKNVTLEGEKAALQVNIDTLKGEATNKEVEQMLASALTAGKITVPIKTQLASVYAGKPDLLKIDLESRGAYTPIAAALAATGGHGIGTQGEYADLQKATWDDLHKTNKLPNLKSKFPDLYKEKYKGKYGVYPTP